MKKVSPDTDSPNGEEPAPVVENNLLSPEQQAEAEVL